MAPGIVSRFVIVIRLHPARRGLYTPSLYTSPHPRRPCSQPPHPPYRPILTPPPIRIAQPSPATYACMYIQGVSKVARFAAERAYARRRETAETTFYRSYLRRRRDYMIHLARTLGLTHPIATAEGKPHESRGYRLQLSRRLIPYFTVFLFSTIVTREIGGD